MSNASIRDGVSHLQFSEYEASPKTAEKKKSRARFQQEIIRSYGLNEEHSIAPHPVVGSKPREVPSKTYPIKSSEPSIAKIHIEIEKMKLAGLMTEIPSRTNFVSSEIAPSVAPYWIISTLACFWLVYSMTTSLPGHWFGNLLIAVAFEFTPMLMLGARVDRKHQKTVSWGSLGIFLVGLGLYLAPSVQMLVNESSAYAEASVRYDASLKDYQSKNANNAALIEATRADADRSQKGYEDAVTAYGENSWRTAAAKKQKVSDAAEWKRQSSAAELAKAPVAPKISDDLTKAGQAIAIRIGLFAVVFLSMFVMQRLERPETA